MAVANLSAKRKSEDDLVIERALEILGNRVRGPDKRYVISGPHSSKEYLTLKLGALDREVFCCVFLNTQLEVIAMEELFAGTLNETPVFPREVCRRALLLNAAAVVLAHNHPSGAAVFSDSDKRLTVNLREALKLIDVVVLDHILVAGERSVSLATIEANEETRLELEREICEREAKARLSAAAKAAWARRRAAGKRPGRRYTPDA